VGDGGSVACGACGCVASAPKCTSPQMFYYSDGACMTQVEDFVVDSKTCSSVSVGGFGSFRYTATASATYTPGSSTPTASLTNQKTVCCR